MKRWLPVRKRDRNEATHLHTFRWESLLQWLRSASHSSSVASNGTTAAPSSVLVFIRISSILLVIIPQNLRKHAGKWLTSTYLLKFHSFFAGISIKTRFERGTWCWLFAASWPVSSSSAAPLCVSPSGSVIRCFGTKGSGHTLTTRPKWSYFSIDSALFFLYKLLQADKVQWYQVNDEKNSASSVQCYRKANFGACQWLKVDQI